MKRHIVITVDWKVQGDEFRADFLLVNWLRSILAEHIVAFRGDVDPQMKDDIKSFRFRRQDEFYRRHGVMLASERLRFEAMMTEYNRGQACGGPPGFDDYIINLTYGVHLKDSASDSPQNT